MLDHRLYLREVKKDDINLLFDWANDPSVRINSFTSNAISFEEHQNWFNKLLENSTKTIFIYCFGDFTIGQVRIEEEKDNILLIDYSIDKNFRGQGYGKLLLGLLIQEVKARKIPVRELVGYVKYENIPSQRVFEATGFDKINKDIYIEYRKKVY